MMYLPLLRTVLTDLHRAGRTEYVPILSNRGLLRIKLLQWISRLLERRGFAICRVKHTSVEMRSQGKDWPGSAETMIGMKRLQNIDYCLRQIYADRVPGDIIETGVWRGGACIYMNAFMHTLGLPPRDLYVCDSFEGLPKPDGRYREDEGDTSYMYPELSISQEEVQHNFKKYNLLTANVHFVKGWFKDTLHTIPSNGYALIRLDGDMYSSTMDALRVLYPELSVGGFCIIDDYGAVPGCKQAVDDYRNYHGITEPIQEIDWGGVYWRKEIAQ